LKFRKFKWTKPIFLSNLEDQNIYFVLKFKRVGKNIKLKSRQNIDETQIFVGRESKLKQTLKEVLPFVILSWEWNLNISL